LRRSARTRHDIRNRLNDLTNVEWLTSTKSVWQSRPPPRDELKQQHPATFAESDVEKLILFFTKKRERVLDPFLGSGSTLIACLNTHRNGLGIELVVKWANIARRRLEREEEDEERSQPNPQLEILRGDARQLLPKLKPESFDFVVTSPPYWKILTKARDHKSKRERLSRGLPTKYSEDRHDLGNAPRYGEFLAQLTKVFAGCYSVLKGGRYAAVIVSDFRHGSRFIAFHSDLANGMERVGFSLEGITILAQDSKNLYPYGMPYAFVSNIHHQYILIFRKPATSKAGPRSESQKEV